MWILSLFLLFSAIFGAYAGFRNWFRFDQLTKTNVLNATLFILIVFTALMIMYILGFFPQVIAAPFMMTVYSVAAGFFAGFANRLLSYRKKAGTILYQYRSFWIDHAPSLLAIVLILYGLYRTSILTDLPVTGIRVTSGISLMSFGFFTWTLKVVPEFRSKGVLFLDRFIHWKEIIAWSWQSETSIGIEFLDMDKNKGERIKEFYTSIPEEEKKEIEMVLKSKMEEYADERKKILFKDEDG
jgi:hypothetical protein